VTIPCIDAIQCALDTCYLFLSTIIFAVDVFLWEGAVIPKHANTAPRKLTCFRSIGPENKRNLLKLFTKRIRVIGRWHLRTRIFE